MNRAPDHDHDRLSWSLKQWPDIEPAPDFDAAVWRQIRTAGATRATLGEWLRRMFREPAYAMPLAVVLAVAIGVWGGIRSVPRPADPVQNELGFLAAGTLAGSYGQLITVEDRR